MEAAETAIGELVPLTDTSGEIAVPELPIRDQLVMAWLLAQKSPDTRQAYRSDITGYFEFCDRQRVDPLGAPRLVVDGYRNWLTGPDPTRKRAARGYSPASVARKLCAVSSFYDYVVAETPWMTDNAARRANRPEVADESTTRGLDLEEARALLAAAGKIGGLDGALVHLLLGCGLRVSEACSAMTSDIEMERGIPVLTVTRKGGKRQRIAIPAPAAHALDRYLTTRRREDRAVPLFVMNDRQITRQQAADALARVAARAGITERISPHSLRHAAATLMLDAGVPLRDVQRLLGHVDPRTTMRYDRARGDIVNSPVHVLAAALIGDEA